MENKINKLVNEIRNYITNFGEDGVLEMLMQWAYWDDNDSEHEIDDAYLARFTEVKFDGDSILIKIDEKYYGPIDLPFEEDDDEILEAMLDELYDQYGEIE